MKDNEYQATEPLNDNDEEENVVLPCDKYKDRLAFYLAFFKSIIGGVIFLVIVYLMLFFVPLFFVPEGPRMFLLIMSILCLPYLMALILIPFSFTAIIGTMGLEGEMKFYAEIVRFKPCSDVATWNVIGYHMDLYFRERNCIVPLFNGSDYYDLFKKLTSPSTTKACSDQPSSATQNPTEILERTDNSDQFDDSATIHNEQRKESQLIYLETAREKAVHAFRESEDKYWVSQYPEFAA
ncbi:similar to Saccharomyces cerevisiae YHL044W Putative integral membrane protein, member of DUP240 gene family [Maudiozyma saulgeensis]|uniref:Similar to Saccharomyces cerevisiae YHL044W Putative integral membrane protein, member of DUP240 gene family n=1 Tax=Maudiozyma saulgeensis TaxID=1789683 RepID=A0A1X7R2H9_9SACH|nr:similar to Saccharomyces cerevisiae YHL044W Putative integral membrane protein, member of DUP240 gene family [Kazachstania saulgeensis]